FVCGFARQVMLAGWKPVLAQIGSVGIVVVGAWIAVSALTPVAVSPKLESTRVAPAAASAPAAVTLMEEHNRVRAKLVDAQTGLAEAKEELGVIRGLLAEAKSELALDVADAKKELAEAKRSLEELRQMVTPTHGTGRDR